MKIRLVPQLIEITKRYAFLVDRNVRNFKEAREYNGSRT